MNSMLTICCRLLLIALCFLPAAAQAGSAVQLTIDGPISPATAMDVDAALDRAEADKASLVILRMNTPGGLDQSMRRIIQHILASPVPVVTYVAPQGARAASAGTYILYASHVAAMAPATNLGAATPVQIGGMPGAPEPNTPAKPKLPADKNSQEKPHPDEVQGNGDAMHHKMINDASAYIRSLAELRGRNADWGEKAVRQASSLSAKKALEEHVIDLIATDTADLLQQLDGRKVKLASGEITLHTQGIMVSEQEPDWRSKFLAIITDPNVAYILMLLGIYGLFFELANPGSFLPGIIGGICLLLALFAFQVLPINFAGLALILLGVAFMVAEAFVPSFGALGIGGVIAFAIGSLMLLDADVPGYAISIGLIAAVTISTALFCFFIIGMAVKARQRPVVTGAEEVLGALGTAYESFSGRGIVLMHGETWQAESAVALSKGQAVRVTGRNGLLLTVEPIESTAKESSS